MGTVFEARNRGTGRRVAIKVIAGEALAKNKEVVSRFQREALASGAIESQYIAHVLDTGVDPATGSPYMVMELLSGEDIESAIKRIGPLPPDVALRAVAQACLGLQKAHEAGVVHRDIKPANIYLATRDGGEIVAKVLDFGIAKVKMEELSGQSRGLTQTGSMLGTPLYMSPEQALAKKTIDHRTDLWSLGAVLYEALCGTTPHAHCESVGELIMSICSQPARPIQELAPWVRPEIAAIVHRALAMDPNARFQTADEMYRAIAALLPNGHWLNVSMFVPLGPEVRGATAPHHSVPGDVRLPPPPSLGGQGPSAPAAMASFAGVPRSTTAGFAQSAGSPPSRRPLFALLGFGASAVVGAGIAGVMALTASGHTASAPPTAASSVAAVAATPQASPSSAPSSPPVEPLTTVQETPPLPQPKPRAATTPSQAKGLPSQQVAPKATAVASAAPAAMYVPPVVPTTAAPNCNPPYTVDRRGRLRAKPECSPKGTR
jgi:serine/threonine-protein kinase